MNPLNSSELKNDIALRLYRLHYDKLNEFSQEFVDDVVSLIAKHTEEARKDTCRLIASYAAAHGVRADYFEPDTKVFQVSNIELLATLQFTGASDET